MQDFSSFEEYLGPDTHKRLMSLTDETAVDVAQHNGDHAVSQQWALLAYSAIHHQLKIVQDAFAKRAGFLEAVGAQSVTVSRPLKIFAALLLTVAAVVEANLAFPGIRFSLGRVGNIDSPFEDPLSLSAALIVGLVSVTVAHLAATQFSWSERSLMKDPEEPTIHHHHLTPRAVQPDEPGHHQVLGSSPFGAWVAGLSDDHFEYSIGTPVAVSDEVQAEESRRHDEAKQRLTQVLLGGRDQGLSRKIGIGLVAFGVGLWTVNGVLRVAYLSRLHPNSGPATGGLLGSAPTGHSASLVSGPTEVAIVLFSILLFLAAVGIIFAMHTPAQLRAAELCRNADTEKKKLIKELKAFERAIRDHENIKSKIDVAVLQGRTAQAAESIPQEEF